MNGLSPEIIASTRANLGIPDQRLPKSVAIIMDGNGRWAQQRGMPRVAGHATGALSVRKIVTEAARLDLKSLTLFGFSVQNWNRPADEIDALMHLYAQYLESEREMVMSHNIRMRHIGNRDGLPQSVLDEIDISEKMSSTNTGMYLCLALNYGGRAEITNAVRKIAKQAVDGDIAIDDINDDTITGSLYTAGVPDPDLVVRTSGELRVSNFLLWQISYAELYVTETLWPDFDETEFHKALTAFSERNRRFGGLNDDDDANSK
ncbi:MAG: isoprenyl transferase [Phycisphaerales bacterium]|jgi:undecaprenyl diphosphate synthase|nr:isoprenyl transferase [Phycisphaerales bacterium]